MTKFRLEAPTAPQTREELVAERLRQAILVGYFKPGERIDQASIAKQLDVSRSPVREALRTLTAEGLLTNRPHRGVEVTKLSPHEIRELHFIRAMLEAAAARRSTADLTDEIFDELESIIEEADETEDYAELLALNHKFHFTIYEAHPQEHLCQMIHQIRNKLAPYIRLYLDGEGHRTRAWDDHREILEALRARDPDLSEETIRVHVQHICDGILKELDRARAETPEKRVVVE